MNTANPTELPVQTPIEELSPEQKILIDEMIQAGVLHGRKHSRTNPKMVKFIFGTRRGVDVFDLVRTADELQKAIDFLKKIIEEKKQILVVGVKPATRDLVENFAKKFNFPYVVGRWLGGTITNFKTINKRIEHLKKLRSDKESGRLDKYTKKERLMFDRELEKMESLFSGIENMVGLPATLFVVDTVEHTTAIREANRLNIPVVGLINTDGDPDVIQYHIPCNDNARPSVAYILNKIEKELSS